MSPSSSRELRGDLPTEPMPTGPLGPGGRLARARRDKGIPLDDVVGFLKYGSRQIEALEADDYEALPPAPVVRGMVRGYARFLGMDAEPLLEELSHILKASPVEFEAQLMDIPFHTKRTLSRWIWWLVPGALVLALVVLAVEFFLSPHELGFFKLWPWEWSRPEAGSVGSSAPAGGVPRDSEGAQAGSAARATVGATGTSTSVSGATPASRARSAVTARVEVRFGNSSWLEVRAADGQVLVSQVMEAGSQKVIEGRPPFSVVIGAAHGVTLIYNGEPVNLLPYTTVDVARVLLN